MKKGTKGYIAYRVQVGKSPAFVNIYSNILLRPIQRLFSALNFHDTHLQASEEEDGDAAGEADARASRGTRRSIFC